MFQLNPNYVTDRGNKKVAVQLNIKTYEKIEEILENYGLYHLMEDESDSELLKVNEAKVYYTELERKNNISHHCWCFHQQSRAGHIIRATRTSSNVSYIHIACFCQPKNR
jgi:hypothetical protein